MSQFDDRVAAARLFLANRASLRRVTNFHELTNVLVEMTASYVGDRDEIAAALRAVDDVSLAEGDFLLSSLVVHFWDAGAGHRFFDAAIERGLIEATADAAERQAFHASQVGKAFAAYPAFVSVVEMEDADSGDSV